MASAQGENTPGSVALVTGGSKGIGRAIALEFGQRGVHVAVGYGTDEAGATSVASTIDGAGGHALPVHIDVRSTESVQAAFRTIESAWDEVTVLVNSAGVADDHLFMLMDEAAWSTVLDVNLSGVYRVCHRAIKGMMRRRYGRIVTVGSAVGAMGGPGVANYAAAKAGLVGLVRSMAREVASRGITCNVVAPGPIDTDMLSGISPEWREQLRDLVPAKRFGTPEEVAAAVGFLCSPEAAYVNGAVLAVDGGLSMGL
jgi:3-oxoacyl-[acyl-carrier protein] reductase